MKQFKTAHARSIDRKKITLSDRLIEIGIVPAGSISGVLVER